MIFVVELRNIIYEKENYKLEENKTNTIMVAYSETGDSAVLIVGRKTKLIGVDILNSFGGDEARELWKKLTEAKK